MKATNKKIIFVVIVTIIILIGIIDYATLPELSFSLFYLIPLTLLSLYGGANIIMIVASSLLASILWFVADFYGTDYSNIFFPIWNAAVRLCIFLAIGFLIQHFKKKQKEIHHANIKLKSLNDEKNKFIGIAAHDVRAPIANIYPFTNSLLTIQCENLNTEAKQILNIVKDQSERSLEMLEDLLNVAKIESGKIELKLEKQDYLEFVNNQIDFCQLLALKKNITINLETKLEQLLVEFDKSYMSEVLDNLLSNAIKYSNKDSNVIVRVSDEKRYRVLTEVIDNGKGIPISEQKKLFNYFQKTSVVPTSGEHSTGLGLAIAKKIITLHKGTIGVKSDVDKGSNFYFSIPGN